MCDIFIPNSGFALCAKPWSWRSAKIEIMSFTVTDLKKKKKSINWQILKCHGFSGCSAQKPIWRCQYPSPQQPCDPAWLQRLQWILDRSLFALASSGTPHIFCRRTSALLPSPSGICGSTHSTRRVRGFFWEVLLAGPPSWISSAIPALGSHLSWPEPGPRAELGALGAASSTREWWGAQSPYQQ